MKENVKQLSMLILILVLISCTQTSDDGEGLHETKETERQKKEQASSSGHSSDHSGKPVNERKEKGGEYESIKIGKQEWMAKNLDVERFANGDPIPHAVTDEEWEKAGDEGRPAWCYYNNTSCYNETVGKLYNFFAVDDPRGLAPEGWHVASDEEWNRLANYLEENIADKLKSESGWFNGGNGTNETGFSALPGGMRYYDGEFLYYGDYGYWWTSSTVVIEHAHIRYMVHDYGAKVFRTKGGRRAGMAVRCIRDYDDPVPCE